MGLELFLLSDLHAFDGANSQPPHPSFFDISLPENGSSDNAVASLKSTMHSEGWKADYLVCCGDLADKARPSAIERAWGELQQMRQLLGARRIIATVGNHDLDSKHTYNDHDAKGVLLGLLPPYPFEEENENNHFWTHHFTVFWDQPSKIRFIVINSSGFHGETENEYRHGRIAKRTLSRLKKVLRADKRPNVNILICHHHPQKHSELQLGDYDDMEGGYELLQALDSVEFGPWIVFHGHKHHAKITYSQSGGNCGPVVFSLGSCAAIPNPQLAVRNQVYSVNLPSVDDLKSTCAGTYRSWDWAPGRGWQTSLPGSGLPGSGGFGFRGDIGTLAGEIAHRFSDARWNAVKDAFPDLHFLLPSDLQNLCLFLKQAHGFRIEEGKDGTPILIEK